MPIKPCLKMPYLNCFALLSWLYYSFSLHFVAKIFLPYGKTHFIIYMFV